MKSSIAVIFLIGSCYGQFIYQQPIPYALQQDVRPIHEPQLAHRDVVENSLREQQLPREFLNKFYDNPKTADALAKESWFTSKEMPVFQREAEKIPREQVYKIFKNAGFVKRR